MATSKGLHVVRNAGVVLYALRIRDRTQGFLHTGDFAGPDVEDVGDRKARRAKATNTSRGDTARRA
jgi:hypothetical protein